MNTRIATSLPFTEYEVATGNYDTTRAPIDRIVLHTEVGFKTGTEATFDNPSSHVSAHYGVNMDGTLDHYLEETFTAYHAGDYAMNQRSIGIEHEDFAKPNEPRTDALYAMSAKLVRDIATFYQIPIDRTHIRKHSEVSDVATACPDSLDVDRIVREAAAAPSNPDQATIDNLNAQIAQLKTQASTKDTEIAELTKQLAAKQQTIDTLQPQADQVPALQAKATEEVTLRAQAEGDRTNAQIARDRALRDLATAQKNDYTLQQPSTLFKEWLQAVLGR